MKSGTSTLHALLGEHPQIFMSEPKEPCYFIELEALESPAREVVEKWGFWRSEERYLELFRDAGGAPVVGESSTNYSKRPRMPGAPERIAAFAPAARILYIMRDPVERTISHYWHAVGQRKERRDLATALEEEPHYREVSHYAFQLEPYLRLFGRERVHTLTLEELQSDAPAKLEGIFRWLGVDAGFAPADRERRDNVTPGRVERVRGEGKLDAFRDSALWNRIGPLIPSAIRKLGRSLAAENVDRSEVDVERAAALLRPQQLEQTAELEELLGRSFVEWRTLGSGD
jgi:hypothetical protein